MINKIKDKVVLEVIEIFRKEQASVYLVGGAVRDFYYQKDVYDYDFEIYNISFEKCLEILKQYDLVVNDKFRTIKINNNIELAMPRVESKTDISYNDYVLDFDVISLEEACKRRDFTINSLMYDVIEDVLYDFNGCMNDLNNKQLRINNINNFNEDSIRVLRGLDLVVRYDLEIELQTSRIMQEMLVDVLKQPRFITTRYFEKIINNPNFINYLELFVKYIIKMLQLDEIFHIKSNNKYHPEKYLFKHIVGSLKVLFLFDLKYKDYNILFWAVLFHDFGKVQKESKHQFNSSEIFNKVADKLVLKTSSIKIINELIIDHMDYREFSANDDIIGINNLKKKYNNQIYLLEILATCDYAGRVADYNENIFKERIIEFQNEIVFKYKIKEY